MSPAKRSRRAASAKPKLVLVLFVAGTSPRSTEAILNVRRLLGSCPAGEYVLDIVDIYQVPEALQQEQVIAAPTLVRKMPLPVRRFIGTLSNTERLLVALGISAEE